MADNIHTEEEKKAYPRRLKKSLFDEETWETSQSKKKQNRKIRKSVVNSNNDNDSTNNRNDSKPNCKKCFLVCKNKNELTKHEAKCFPKSNEKESFLKNLPRNADDPRVILEKVVIPSSQPLVDIQEESTNSSTPNIDFVNHGSGQISGATSYAEAAKRSPQTLSKQKLQAPLLPDAATNTAVQQQAEGNNKIATNNDNPKENYKARNKTKHSVDESSGNEIPMHGNSPTNPDIETIYGETMKWRRNIFRIPKGNLGKGFIDEKTALINRWINTREDEALMLLMMMPNLLLQRTSKKVQRARENKNHLRRRWELWVNGEYLELMKEAKCVQQRLENSQSQQAEGDLIKRFRNHMIKGNINSALRLLDQTSNKGILPISDETIKLLHEKHPVGEPQHEEMLLNGPVVEITR